MVQIGCSLFIQADGTDRATLDPDMLTSLPERLQVLAVAVSGALIKQVDHLLDIIEVPGEPGRQHLLVTCAWDTESERRNIVLLDDFYELLNPDGDIGLR
jgi:hypothetical protein